MPLEGAILLLSDLHFGRDLLDPPELPVVDLPRLVQLSNLNSLILRFFENRCLGHSLDVVLSLPSYLQYLITLFQAEGYRGSDFDYYVLLGDQVTIPDPQSYRFLRHYITEYEYEAHRGPLKTSCSGLRVDPNHVIAIPGNHDKLLRTDLALYNDEFAEPLDLEPMKVQQSQIFIRRISRYDLVFILIDANAYASTPATIGSDLRDHVACGRVTEVLVEDISKALKELRSSGRLGEESLQSGYKDAIKILVVHYAVNDWRVAGLTAAEHLVIPHRCEGLGKLVSSLGRDFGLNLVVHGHLHRPALYTYEGVPVVACTTATQQNGSNGFHVLKIFDSGELHAEYHRWAGSAFVRDGRLSVTRRILPV